MSFDDEAVLHVCEQQQTGCFTLQTLVSGPFRLEGGARVELSKLNAEQDEQLGTGARSRKFTTWSGSLGGQYEFSPGWRAGLTLSRSSRAPSVDELFANGPHAASHGLTVETVIADILQRVAIP